MLTQFDTQIQSDELIPAPYNMTPEEYTEFQQEYNSYLDKETAERPMYLWLKEPHNA
jgi:hypothetical protein